jgi:hypothetical protein
LKISDYAADLLKINLFKGFDEASFIDFFKGREYKIDSYNKEDIIFIEDDQCKNLSVIL